MFACDRLRAYKTSSMKNQCSLLTEMRNFPSTTLIWDKTVQNAITWYFVRDSATCFLNHTIFLSYILVGVISLKQMHYEITLIVYFRDQVRQRLQIRATEGAHHPAVTKRREETLDATKGTQ